MMCICWSMKSRACAYPVYSFPARSIMKAIMQRVLATCAGGLESKLRSSESTFSQGSPRQRCSFTTMAPLRALQPVIWASAQTANRNQPLRQGTNCTPSTPYSLKAVAAIWVNRSSQDSILIRIATHNTTASASKKSGIFLLKNTCPERLSIRWGGRWISVQAEHWEDPICTTWRTTRLRLA